MSDTKTCTRCGKPRTGKRSRCAICEASYRRDYRAGIRVKGPALTPAEARRRRLASYRKYTRKSRLAKYGVTEAQWIAKLTDQSGRCAICRTDLPNGPGKTWHVDHDHVTGEFRGLLCSSCNLILGHAADNPQRLQAAAVYLESCERENQS